jgi:hypothetical protein
MLWIQCTGTRIHTLMNRNTRGLFRLGLFREFHCFVSYEMYVYILCPSVILCCYFQLTYKSAHFGSCNKETEA